MQLEIDNLKIAYTCAGPDSNTCVLLLHGWGVDSTSMSPLTQEISKTLKTYTIDFPGFGQSEEPDTTYNVTKYAKVVEEFIEKQKLENVVLIGHSFGGRVIIKLTGELGFKAKKIILIDSAGIRPKKSFKRKIKEKVFKAIKKIAKFILGKKSDKVIDKYKNKLGSTDYQNASVTMKEVFKNVINEDLTQCLKNIDAPTLLIWGENDMDTPLSDAKIMEKEIPNAGLVVVEGATHYSFLDNFPYCMRVIQKFLEGCD